MNELTISVPKRVYERIWARAQQVKRPVDAVIVESLQAIFLPATDPAPNDVTLTVTHIRRWLAQQHPSATRLPVSFPEAERQALDQEFEDLISAIHNRNQGIPVEEVMDDVAEARRQVQDGR